MSLDVVCIMHYALMPYRLLPRIMYHEYHVVVVTIGYKILILSAFDISLPIPRTPYLLRTSDA
jgi:hypothetical protein